MNIYFLPIAYFHRSIYLRDKFKSQISIYVRKILGWLTWTQELPETGQQKYLKAVFQMQWAWSLTKWAPGKVHCFVNMMLGYFSDEGKSYSLPHLKL